MMKKIKLICVLLEVTWERQIDVCGKELTSGLDPGKDKKRWKIYDLECK